MKRIVLINNRTGLEYEYVAKENHELLYDTYSRGQAICLYEREKAFDKYKYPIAVFFGHSIHTIE